MNPVNRGASGLTLALALTVSAGCSGNNIALVGRDTPPSSATQTVPDEFVATVERVNTGSREINLRPNDGGTRVVGYSTDTRVMYRGREYPVSQLEVGDIVAMQLRQDSHRNSYTDLIRVQESIQDRNRRRSDISRPAIGIQTVDGRVEQVDFQRNSFEMRDQSREGFSFLFPTTLAGRMSIVSARFGLAITSESRGDSSIGNDLSWTAFFGMIVSRFTIGVA
jgi:hypothetical protein